MNQSVNPNIQNTANFSPTKGFFVEMLTRDIELKDAILDLLDNCVDGIQRLTEGSVLNDTPYDDFWAKIKFSDHEFIIEDNCGGIPIESAQHYAFRMGRPSDFEANENLYTIGTYGIGMKRAIFKMGQSCEVISRTQNDAFKVSINKEWLLSDDTWTLPIESLENGNNEFGTKVHIRDLYPTISQDFASSNSTLYNDLISEISKHYMLIFQKGFKVWVNGNLVEPKLWCLRWDGKDIMQGETIAPYLYSVVRDGVEVKIAIGFHTEMPKQSEVEKSVEGKGRRGDDSGWTVICNDRVVVYCDKTRLTGWGEAKVPSYHPQYIGISGIVEFRSHDSRKLPITTTKRGLDSSSDVYLYVKNFMREGLKLFIGYTNKWKYKPKEEQKRFAKTQAIDPSILFTHHEVPWKKTRSKDTKSRLINVDEKKYIPNLPLPTVNNNGDQERIIRFTKSVGEISEVAEYLFEEPERDATEVGEECFDRILKLAQRK